MNCFPIFVTHRAGITVSCTLCRPFQVSRRRQLFHILHEIELSFHGSLVHPCRPDFQRNKARFKTCATVMCTFCRRFLLIEQKRRPYISDCGSRLQEKTGFHTQESFLAWIHRFSTRYNSHVCSVMMHLTWLMIWLQWWLGWHDDVVHMMMWLPWWWES